MNHYKKDGDRVELLYNVGGQLVGPILGGIFSLLYLALLTVISKPFGIGTWLYLGIVLMLFAYLTILLARQCGRKLVITPDSVRWYQGKKCLRSCDANAVRVIFQADYASKQLQPVMGIFGGTEEELYLLGRRLVEEERQVTLCDGKTFQQLQTAGRITREIYRSIPYLTERLGGEWRDWPLFYFEPSREREKLLREIFPQAQFIHLKSI